MLIDWSSGLVWLEGVEGFFVAISRFFDWASILRGRGRCCGGGTAGCKLGDYPRERISYYRYFWVFYRINGRMIKIIHATA